MYKSFERLSLDCFQRIKSISAHIARNNRMLQYLSGVKLQGWASFESQSRNLAGSPVPINLESNFYGTGKSNKE